MVPKKSCGCQGGSSPREGEGIEVVWHDPTKYDPVRHGPPYLPVRLATGGKVTARKAARHGVNPRVARRLMGSGAPLGAVLAVLRAASFLHQTHHWQTSGRSYYADHLLFDRLYKDSQAYIDQVAERAVGLASSATVTPAQQASRVSEIVGMIAGPDAKPDTLVLASLRVESLVLAVVENALETLAASESLTPGVDNLLQGIADLHETFVYLLQQRASDSYDYAR